MLKGVAAAPQIAIAESFEDGPCHCLDLSKHWARYMCTMPSQGGDDGLSTETASITASLV